MKPKKSRPYNPKLELAKGATLDAASYDKTQKVKVTVPKVTVGGIPGRAEISWSDRGRQRKSLRGLHKCRHQAVPFVLVCYFVLPISKGLMSGDL